MRLAEEPLRPLLDFDDDERFTLDEDRLEEEGAFTDELRLELEDEGAFTDEPRLEDELDPDRMVEER